MPFLEELHRKQSIKRFIQAHGILITTTSLSKEPKKFSCRNYLAFTVSCGWMKRSKSHPWARLEHSIEIICRLSKVLCRSQMLCVTPLSRPSKVRLTATCTGFRGNCGLSHEDSHSLMPLVKGYEEISGRNKTKEKKRSLGDFHAWFSSSCSPSQGGEGR